MPSNYYPSQSQDISRDGVPNLGDVFTGQRGQDPLRQGFAAPGQEKSFEQWYTDIARLTGNNPNPDDPAQKYDYRGFYRSGQSVAPDPTDINPETGQPRLHFTSQFKHDDHPNRFVYENGGVLDSKNNRSVLPAEFNKQATPEQRAAFKERTRNVLTSGDSGSPPQYGFKDQPNTNPYAPIVGGAVDALQDPRMGMFPGAGVAGMGFRAAGMGTRLSEKLLPAMEKQIARRVESGALEKGQPYVQSGHALTVEMQKAKYPRWGMEGPPSAVQEATVMRQPQGDQSLARAAEDMRQSMGWTGEQLQQWMSKYRR